VLFNEKMLAGLGRGIVSTGKLDPEAVTPLDGGVSPFPRAVGAGRREQLMCIATAAAREAENGPEFIQQAEKMLGTEIRVLTGKEEAYYSALGVISGFHRPTASPATSAAAASNWSMSGRRRSATASRCRSAACACRTCRKARYRRRARSRDRTCARESC
jgi:hypothetical protein